MHAVHLFQQFPSCLHLLLSNDHNNVNITIEKHLSNCSLPAGILQHSLPPATYAVLVGTGRHKGWLARWADTARATPTCHEFQSRLWFPIDPRSTNLILSEMATYAVPSSTASKPSSIHTLDRGKLSRKFCSSGQ